MCCLRAHGRDVDIWKLGIFLYELRRRCTPFEIDHVPSTPDSGTATISLSRSAGSSSRGSVNYMSHSPIHSSNENAYIVREDNVRTFQRIADYSAMNRVQCEAFLFSATEVSAEGIKSREEGCDRERTHPSKWKRKKRSTTGTGNEKEEELRVDDNNSSNDRSVQKESSLCDEDERNLVSRLLHPYPMHRLGMNLFQSYEKSCIVYV